MSKPFDLVVVGDLNADLILSGDVTPAFGQVEKLLDDASLVIGGSATIFACGAARLGLMAATGADPVAVCTPPRIATEILPNAALRPQFEAAYERFRGLYRG